LSTTLGHDLTASSVVELAAAIRSKQAPVREVLEEHLARIERLNPLVNAIVRLDADRARARACEADEALARGGSWGPLHGVPFTLKDMIEAGGIGASVGTRASERVPDRDGVIAERLQRAGAILLGKTNMSNALQTNSEQFGRSLNPYDTERTTGGSSGGAVAAVAARLSAFDVGTDLSGSIRMPAHFCGVFGLRPTVHRIPLAGMVFGPPGIPRMDRILVAAGPLARTAGDVALLFRVLAGPDARDPDVPPVPTADAPTIDPRRLRVAMAPSIKGIRIAREIEEALEKLAVRLSSAGVQVEEREPLSFEELLPAFRRTLIAALAIAIRAGIAPPGARSMNLPEPTPFDVMAALDERDRFIATLDHFFGDYDAFICPAATVVAFTHRASGSPIDVDGESISSMCVDHPTILSTYTGSPSLVVPIAQSKEGLPIGAQLVGKRWSDERLIATGGVVAEIAGPIPAPTLGAQR
jgi:amidase